MQEIITAILFYMPFLLTVGFALFIFLIGILCFISGTLLLFVFAAYGIYCMLRDTGVIQNVFERLGFLRQYSSEKVLQNMKQSFVLQNTENIPNKSALYICSPHGLVGISWFYYFSFGLGNWSGERPFLATHSVLFKIPIFSDILKVFHCIEASEASLQKTLQAGHSVAIVIGGIEEMKYAGEAKTKLVLKKRKGYIRLAKQAGVPIVPLFTKGENELLGVETAWIWKQTLSLFFRLSGYLFPLPSWEKIVHFAKIIQTPLPSPVETFVLNPIETQGKSESDIQKKVVENYTRFLKEKKINAEIIA